MKLNRGEALALVLVAVAFLMSGFLYGRLPETMPSHWDIHGQSNGFVHKPLGPFLLPAVMGGLFFLFLALPAISPRGFRFDSFENVWGVFEAAMLGLLFLVHTLTLLYAMGKPVDMIRGVECGVGLLLVVLGNFMGKVTRNFFVGIRTPWTIASEEVWLRTHRLGGKLFVLAGLVLFVSGLLGGGWVPGAVAIGAAALVSVVYSYLLYRRIEGFKDGPPAPDRGHVRERD